MLDLFSPEVKLTIHWMVVSLSFMEILSKNNNPIPNVLLLLIPSLSSRFSSCVPFTNHWICCAVPVIVHVNAVLPPRKVTLCGAAITVMIQKNIHYNLYNNSLTGKCSCMKTCPCAVGSLPFPLLHIG